VDRPKDGDDVDRPKDGDDVDRPKDGDDVEGRARMFVLEEK